MLNIDGSIWNRKTILIVIGIVVFAWFIRITYFSSAQFDSPVRADAYKYLKISYNLAHHGRYSFREGPELKSSTLITPGYPFFLSIFVASTEKTSTAVYLTIYSQLFMSAVMVGLVFLILLQYSNLPLALTFSGVVALYPHQVVGPGFLLTETVFCFLLILGIFLALVPKANKINWASFASCICFAIALLVRPAIIIMPLFLLIVLWRPLPNFRKYFACLTIISALAWAPWAYWCSNYADLKESNARQVVTLGHYKDFTYEERRGFPSREDPNYGEISSSWENISNSIIKNFKNEPFSYSKWYLLDKPLSLWGWDVVQGSFGPFVYPVTHSVYNNPGIYRISYLILQALHPITVICALLFSLLVLSLQFFTKIKTATNPALLMSSAIVVYITLVHIPLATLPRFSFPFQPVLLMVLALGIYTLYEEYKKRSQ